MLVHSIRNLTYASSPINQRVFKDSLPVEANTIEMALRALPKHYIDPSYINKKDSNLEHFIKDRLTKMTRGFNEFIDSAIEN